MASTMEIACFPITIKKTNKLVYNYDVSIEMASFHKNIALNKDKSDPMDKFFCRQVLKVAFEKSGRFGSDPKMKYVYDGSSCLYASHKFQDQDIAVEPQEFTTALKEKNFKKPFVVRVTATASNHELDIQTPPEKMTPDQYSECKKFLSLLVCQHALDAELYSVLDHGHLFSLDERKRIDIGNAIELRHGMSKGIRLVEDENGVKFAFEVDFTVSAFFKPTTLAEVLKGFRSPAEANEFLRKVRVCPIYKITRSLDFGGFSKETPLTHTFERKGATITCADYYKNVKQQKINGNLPLAIVHPKKSGLFPAEMLQIIPNQKIFIERLSPKEQDALHTHNAVAPHMRHKNIGDIIQSFKLNAQNEVLKAFGIQVSPTFAVIPPSKIWRPAVMFNGGAISTPKDDGNFRDPAKFRYLVPGAVAKWVVLYADRGVQLDVVNSLIKMLCEEAKRKGINLPKPLLVQSADMAHFCDKGKAFERIKDFIDPKDGVGVSYILIIDPKDGAGSTHSMIKLIENRYKIVTQQLDYAKAKETVQRNQRMTLENVINKLNLKIGGVNYAPKFEAEAAALALDKGTLVIGYQTAHPKMKVDRVFSEGNVRVMEPSVLGFTGNYTANPNLFVGNWLYENAEHEMVDNQVLEDQMFHVLKLLGKYRPAHAKPKNIVVLRDGLSEFNYDSFERTECQALKNACARIDPAYKPKFILIVTTKEHDTRVFNRGANGKIENPTVGTMVDYGVVRKGKEILAIPQKAIKGTAQPVKVTIIKNETNVSFDGIKKFIHALSYTHQLTCSPTGLPEPIYQADILAKRGLSSLVALKTYFPSQVPRTPEKQYDIDGLNKRLSMRGSRLELLRFTA